MRKFISGLILGAGASQRLGPPKQLLPFRGTTMLGWVVAQAQRAAGLDEVVVVLGRAADEMRERVDFGSAQVVENPVFGEGCSSSYRAGIAALDPRVSSNHDHSRRPTGNHAGDNQRAGGRVARERSSDCALLVRGRKGHPMIFAQSMFEQLVSLHGDKAAWKLVDANADRSRKFASSLPFPDDINTLEDFERLSRTETN